MFWLEDNFNSSIENPCEKACGLNSICTVQNNKPICSCAKNQIGNPSKICCGKKLKI